MNEKLRKHIDLLFSEAPQTKATMEVKEELLANLMEHCNDLMESGKSEDEAYAIVVSNIGDVSELIQNLKDANSIGGNCEEDSQWSKENGERTTNKNAEKGWTIGSMIDDFISSVSSAFEMDCQEVNDKSYSSIGIQTINIGFVSETIRFFLHDAQEIRVVEYMSKKPSADELAKVDIYNGEFNIKNGKRLFFIAKSKVDIYLPKSFHGNLNIKVTSSSIKSTEILDLKNFTVKGVSCSVKAEGILSEYTDINVASGTIKLEQLTGRYHLSTESGSIHIGKISGGGECKTTSGSIHLNYEELKDNVSLSVISGSVRLSVPREASFYYNVSAISGNIHTCFNATQYSSSRHSVQGTVGDAPEHNINIKAISGNIWMQNN